MAAVEVPEGASRVARSDEQAGLGYVSLLEVEPDLAGALDDDQRHAAQGFLLPVANVKKDGDIRALVEQSGAFGALVLEGMVLHALRLADRVTLRLLGPGAVIPLTNAPSSLPLGSDTVLVPDRTRVVLLRKEFVLAAHRWPWLLVRLHARTIERFEVLATQLAISQLPRVEDRVMAMMWLLADSFGRVTPAGVALPFSLSHETLGGLVGAQRPTVTLALRALAEHNLLIKQDRGWLILGPPPAPAATEPTTPQPLVAAPPVSPWVARGPVAPLSEYYLRRDDVARLRACRRRSGQLTERAGALCRHSQDLLGEVLERRRVRARQTAPAGLLNGTAARRKLGGVTAGGRQSTRNSRL